jgi:arylsulfatase A-like enzyme
MGRVLLLLFCFALSVVGHLSAQQKPNIVLILTDDLDAVVSPEFFPEVLPVVDSLQKQGVNFTNSFVPISVCCPSRAGLLSGKLGHRTNVMNNGGAHGGWKQFRDDEPTALPAHLSKAGYRTCLIGKYLNGYATRGKKQPPVPYGWTDGGLFVDHGLTPYKGYGYRFMKWQNGVGVNDTVWKAQTQLTKHGKKEVDYSTDVLKEQALQFLNDSAQSGKPFCMFVVPTAPHFPLPPAPRYYQKAVERWAHTPVPDKPNTFADKGKLATGEATEKPLDKPWWIRKTWAKRQRQKGIGGKQFNLFWRGNVPKNIKVYKDADWFNRMGSLYAVNDLVSDVVSTLKKNGQWDNTLLIFTSDNGYQFGNHGLYQKSTPYEESIRVPLVISGGAALKLKQQTNIGEWVINHDLMPTILEMAGVKVPDSLDGRSLAKYLTTGDPNPAPLRNKVLLEYTGPGMMGYLTRAWRLQFFMLPSYFSDLPTYHAVRMKVTGAGGKEVVYKYIEWERYPGMWRLREKLNANNPGLQKRIAKGKPALLKRIEKVKATENELYNLTDDPYELDNLLYYQPEQHKEIAATLKIELEKMMKE